ncbi:MAG TPA: GPR endopeptidase, partial [Lachnospiraceae bacterium]|nr:GPR endopeptidase [Lachnospiraceae bacterium]
LAARSVTRLNTTIQITDTGISPGSGVGNHRNALNKDCLGTKVVAIGVPTVVDAATIVNDAMERFLQGKGFSEEEMYRFLDEVGDQSIQNMFVTPKGIDDAMKRISYTISEALNQCFCKSLSNAAR